MKGRMRNLSKATKAACLLLATALTLTIVPACSPQPEDTPAVRLLNFKPEQDAAYQLIASRYTQLTGIPVSVTTAASGTYDQQLESSFSSPTPATIFQVNGPIGYARWEDYMANMVSTAIYQHLVSPPRALRSPNGTIGAVPFNIEGYGILININIMELYYNLPEAKASGIDDIKSFAALKAVVEDMQAHKDDLGIQGVFAPVSLKQGEDWPWQTHLFNVALYYEWAENHVDVSGGATPPTIEFSQAAGFKQLFDLYLNNNLAAPASSAHTSVNDAMTAFAQGKAAMVQNGNWSLSQIVNAPGAKIDGDDIAFIPLYIGASDEQDQGLCIGSENYYCINKYASPASQQASMDFLDWLYTSPEGIDLVNQELGFLPPFDTFDTETAAMGNQLTRQVLFWEGGMENVHNLPWVFEVIPNQRFKNSLGGYLQQYAIGVLSWDELVAQTKASWAAEASHVEDGL